MTPKPEDQSAQSAGWPAITQWLTTDDRRCIRSECDGTMKCFNVDPAQTFVGLHILATASFQCDTCATTVKCSVTS